MQANNLASNNLHPFLNAPFAVGGKGNLGALWSAQQRGNVERALHDYFSTRLRDAAAPAMDSAVGMLEETSGGIFGARVAESSNPLAVTGEAADGALQSSYVVSVSQLATGQNIISDQLKAADTNAVGRGTYSFLINKDNRDIRFDVRVNASDSNEIVLQKISDEINSADMGMVASVETNPTAGTAWLQVSGVKSGDMHSYTMRDDGGNLLDTLGVSTARYATGTTGGITQSAGNAVFSINGMEFRSDSNEVSLFEDSVTFKFHSASASGDVAAQYAQNGGSAATLPGELSATKLGGGGLKGDYQSTVAMNGAGTVRVTVKPDAEKIADNVISFVKNSEQLSGTLSKGTNKGYRAAGGYIATQFNRNSDALKELGFENNGGGMSVSREKLVDKIKNDFDKVESMFGGPAGLARNTIFGVQRAVYAPFAATSWVQVSPSAEAASGFFRDRTV